MFPHRIQSHVTSALLTFAIPCASLHFVATATAQVQVSFSIADPGLSILTPDATGSLMFGASVLAPSTLGHLPVLNAPNPPIIKIAQAGPG